MYSVLLWKEEELKSARLVGGLWHSGLVRRHGGPCHWYPKIESNVVCALTLGPQQKHFPFSSKKQFVTRKKSQTAFPRQICLLT